MGDFPRAILIACLQVLRWLLFATAALMLVLLIVQQLRGDPGAVPVQLGIGAILMLAAGIICGRAARWFEAGGGA
jgi:hypothetical protein